MSELLQQEEVILCKDALYNKQSYRNRCYILGANKIETLIIPVHAKSGKTFMKDVTIDNHSHWQKNHWKTIQSAYNKSAFFEHYGYLFEPVFQKEYNFLLDIIVETMTICLGALQINKPVCLKRKVDEQEIFDLNPKRKEETDQKYSFEPYFQTFGNEFDHNLSIIDLLFCTGPQSLEVLKKTKRF